MEAFFYVTKLVEALGLCHKIQQSHMTCQIQSELGKTIVSVPAVHSKPSPIKTSLPSDLVVYSDSTNVLN